MIYIHLFHGRTEPDQNMEDWGTSGPTIGPVSLSWTYGDLKVHSKSGDHFEFISKKMVDYMILYDGVYYGDFEVIEVNGWEEREYKDAIPFEKFFNI